MLEVKILPSWGAACCALQRQSQRREHQPKYLNSQKLSAAAKGSAGWLGRGIVCVRENVEVYCALGLTA
jgi:hypothetical protein